MLEHLGHEVVLAASADEALGIAHSETPIDLVITDHAMPGMTGAELIARLRESRPDLPMVLATGYAEIPRDTNTFVPRLDKPFHLETLAAVIAAVMSEQPSPAASKSDKSPADLRIPRYSQA
jgi:CheY-like chemotaxis protein